MRWGQKKDWRAYPWQAVTALRSTPSGLIEQLACGHDGRAMLYEWQRAKRRRCIQCPPEARERMDQLDVG